MKQKFDMSEFDVFFLSYDEPNAEKHWADLLDKAPWAKRVHGVKGFDAAHRECANQSETDWFVTVDADNIVLPEFFDLQVELDPVLDVKKCFSWNGLNMFNGLMYGNGGLKLWSKKFASNMKSHELSEDDDAVDFCWEEDYQQVHQCYSEVWNNATAYQAFRVGFREGVKLALDRGMRLEPHLMKSRLHRVNLRNLRIWASVGADIENGAWAIYGTRMGWRKVCDLNWDMAVIRDYDWFDNYWAKEIYPRFHDVNGVFLPMTLQDEIVGVGTEIRSLTNIEIANLDSTASEFFRETFKLRND